MTVSMTEPARSQGANEGKKNGLIGEGTFVHTNKIKKGLPVQILRRGTGEQLTEASGVGAGSRKALEGSRFQGSTTRKIGNLIRSSEPHRYRE